MKNVIFILSLALFMSLFFAFGCSNGSNDVSENQIAFDLIASEKTLPDTFHDIAFERKETPHFQYLVKKAVNTSEFEDAWNLYAFQNKMPNVDLKEKDVFFIGVHESGSCSLKIKNMNLSADNKTLNVPLTVPDGACTDDATPRTFVIAIDKKKTKNIENAVIVQSGTETSVPLK
ncbi:hypothetical protein ACFFJY_01420 [Fictibacillus aquaticus]|uniref:Lipoprotein n=1 Tax=Fictibacillus aquaticus TaxID=2021314 RepID=A0A235F9I4_9BACL|nr:hypothetical protein [Fictibacillus aquaticus]OYD57375.1 hypothetical protein CGZ90_11890 [Fictibacillus aquaticus]